MAPLVPFLLSLLSLSPVLAAPAPSTHLLKERTIPPSQWRPQRRAPSNHTINLRLFLPQPRMPVLHSALLEISDPSSPRYGQHLSALETADLVRSAPESLEVVHAWLASAGVDHSCISHSQAGGSIALTIPVSLAEKLLNAEYRVYTHAHTGETLVRTTEYSLPAEVWEHVRAVQPTTMFSLPFAFRSPVRNFRPLQSTSSAAPQAATKLDTTTSNITSCTSGVTPACLAHLYETEDYTPSENGTTLGITGYLNQYANERDLKTFYQLYKPEAVDSVFQTVLVNGGQNPQDPSQAGTEANLDVQYGGSLTYPLANTFYSTAGSPPFNPDAAEQTNTNEPYSEWLDYMLALGDDELPSVVSTSYGDDEQSVPHSWADGVCDGFAQLGARGVSIIFASGDFGVGPSANECVSNDGQNRTQFIPNFPASCPWVTTVGATTSLTPSGSSSSDSDSTQEIAASFSGGGFSNYFPRPSYQDSAVSAFLATLGDQFSGLYNTSGRAYPDVSAQGQNFHIVISGQLGTVDGTSCSAPTFASVIALVNDALVRAGKPVLGFLNPWLYSEQVTGGGGVRDVVMGRNPGCGTEGFAAGEGWDAVTGLGTPVFTKLRELAGA